MPSLRDLIPQNSRTEFDARTIKPGAVFLQYVDDLKKDSKFFIVLSVNTVEVIVSSIYINTNINPNVIRTKNQRTLQYRLKQVNNKFLDHDSWVDSSQIRERNYDIILTDITFDKIKFIADLDQKEFDTIRSYMAASPHFSTIQKRMYGLI